MRFLTTWAGALLGRSAGHPWREYLAGIARGEQPALARLYDESSSLVYSVTLKILGNSADAEEVLLDVYLEVWRRAADYGPERGSPTAWLMALARSRSLDRVRGRDTRRSGEMAMEEGPLATGHPAPEEARWVTERRQELRGVLDELNPEQRAALELAYFEGLSYSDLATRLQLPVGTMRTGIHLAMSRLRQRLAAGPEVVQS